MDKDLKKAKEFTKDLVRKPTEDEIKKVNKNNKSELFFNIFMLLCTLIALSGTVVFILDIFMHIVLDYYYVSIIIALFFATFSFCFVYDEIYRWKDFLKIKKGDFFVCSGKILNIKQKTNTYTEVNFLSEFGWTDDLNYRLYGKNYCVEDDVLFVALFNKKDELINRFLVKN